MIRFQGYFSRTRGTVFIALFIISWGCTTGRVMDSRVKVWEEEALELERRGESREAARLRDMIDRVRPKEVSRLDRQLDSELRAAEAHYKESRLTEAKYILRYILDRDPDSPGAQILLLKIDNEVFSPASDKPFSRMAEELYKKGMKRYRRGDVEGAFDFLSQARQIYRGDPVLIQAYKRAEASLADFQRNRRAGDLYEQGREFLSAGQADEALKMLLEAQALDPSLPQVSEYLEEAEKAVAGRRMRRVQDLVLEARSQTKKKNYIKALAMVEEALELSKGHKEAVSLRRDIIRRQNEKDEAKSKNVVFRTAVAEARDALATGDLRGARKHMATARAVRPGSPTLEELGKKADQIERGRTQDARRQADEKYRLGLIAYRQGRLEEARELFEESLRHVPGHAKAAKALLRIPE